MSNLSSILKTMMNEVKITVTELARQTGVGQPVIHRMASGETDNPKVGSLSPIAKFFNLNISQLIGDEPLPAGRVSGSHNPYYRSWNQVPLLSWEQAVHWPNEAPGGNDIASYVATDSNVSEHAFAIRMEDNTMFPRYPEGSVLVIEPTIKAGDKDFAAVRVAGQNKIHFKQVLFDNDELYLKPLNPDFEIRRVEEEHQILGVLVQSLTEYYQDRVSPKQTEYVAHKPPVKKRRDKDFADILE